MMNYYVRKYECPYCRKMVITWAHLIYCAAIRRKK